MNVSAGQCARSSVIIGRQSLDAMQICCPLFLKMKVTSVKVEFETSKVASWGDEGLEKLKGGWQNIVALSNYVM